MIGPSSEVAAATDCTAEVSILQGWNGHPKWISDKVCVSMQVFVVRTANRIAINLKLC